MKSLILTGYGISFNVDGGKLHIKDGVDKGRKDPEKLAIDVARNTARFQKRRSDGLCPACGDVPTEGIYCDSCKERIREYNSRNK